MQQDSIHFEGREITILILRVMITRQRPTIKASAKKTRRANASQSETFRGPLLETQTVRLR